MKAMKIDQAAKRIEVKVVNLLSALGLTDADVKGIYAIASANPYNNIEVLGNNKDVISRTKMQVFRNFYGKEIAESDDFRELLTAILVQKAIEESIDEYGVYFIQKKTEGETALADYAVFFDFWIAYSYDIDGDSGKITADTADDEIIIKKIIPDLWCYGLMDEAEECNEIIDFLHGINQ